MSLAVKDIVHIAQTNLERNNIEDAKLDAELIFRHLMGVDKMGFFKLWGVKLDDAIYDRYLDLVTERSGGKPLQYITGEQEFMGFEFRVNPEVLIPRRDTEIIVSDIVSVINERKKSCTVLDLGCGCGVIGISIAKLCANARVTMSDISKAAVETARQNALSLEVAKKASFYTGNWFEPFNKRIGRVKFDYIVSNPPYIKSREISSLQREIREHEPLIALDGGLDGLSYYRIIIPKAPLYLKKGGMFAFEIGMGQLHDVLLIAADCDFYQGLRVVKDLAGHDRVVVLTV